MKNEFDGKPFCPSSFFWKTQNEEKDKVESVCRILNELTREQIEAVNYVVHDSVKEVLWNHDVN